MDAAAATEWNGCAEDDDSETALKAAAEETLDGGGCAAEEAPELRMDAWRKV
jgi:hypothetical protein